jgi:hypothetical protein
LRLLVAIRTCGIWTCGIRTCGIRTGDFGLAAFGNPCVSRSLISWTARRSTTTTSTGRCKAEPCVSQFMRTVSRSSVESQNIEQDYGNYQTVEFYHCNRQIVNHSIGLSTNLIVDFSYGRPISLLIFYT